MCDYSLAALRTRLARESEDLVIYRFPTGSLGLTSPDELTKYGPNVHGWWSTIDATQVPCAVCIPHGAQLMLRDIPERLQRGLGVNQEEAVTFIQMSAETGRHRDGIRFKNGLQVLLQRFSEGERARVLSLSPAARAAEPETEGLAA